MSFTFGYAHLGIVGTKSPPLGVWHRILPLCATCEGIDMQQHTAAGCMSVCASVCAGQRGSRPLTQVSLVLVHSHPEGTAFGILLHAKS